MVACGGFLTREVEVSDSVVGGVAGDVFSHRGDRFADHFRRVDFVKNGKLDAVKARDPEAITNPEITVVRLQNALDVVLGWP